MTTRLKLWGLLLTSSIVSMLSIVTTLDKRKETSWERHERWIMSVACISICFSFLGALVSCLPGEQAMKLESPIITICLGFWSAGMPALMDPDNGLAVTEGGGILNANLYFFGWGCLAAGILLAGDVARQANGDEASLTAVQWVCLAASSFVLMGTSTATYQELGCRAIRKDDDDSSTTCNRNLFAVILGVCSGVVAMAMIPLKQAPPACQAVISVMLLTAWGCGVAYITFDDGPGSTLGNVYFATWISLYLCVNITTTCISQLVGDAHAASDDDDEPAASKKAAGDGASSEDVEDTPEAAAPEKGEDDDEA